MLAGCAPAPFPQRPIAFRINVHDHAYGLTAADRDADDFLDRKREAYDLRTAHLDWLVAIARAHGQFLSLQLNGETARDARVLWDDLARYEALLEEGHTIGVHFHGATREPGTEFWELPDPDTMTDDRIAEAWLEHVEEVGLLRGSPPRRVDAGTPRDTEERASLHDALLDTYDVAIESVGDAFTYTPWNHAVWEPFPRAPGTRLAADPGIERLAMDAYPQVGREEPSGNHVVLSTVPALGRHLLQLLATWWTAAREGWPDRAWTFGVTVHLPSPEFDPDLVDLLNLVDELAEAVPGPDGEAAIVPATDETLLADRAEAPGTFSFDFEAWLAGEEVPYPWPEVQALAEALVDTELVELADVGQPRGVIVALLDHRAVERGEREEDGSYAVTVGGVDGRCALLLSTRDLPRTVALGGLLGRHLEVLDGRTGLVRTVHDGRVVVREHPLVVRPVAD